MRDSRARSAGPARNRVILTLGFFLAALSLLLSQSALGAGASNGGTSVVVHRVHSRAHLRAFWTPKRIRHATPLSVLRFARPGGRLVRAGAMATASAAGPGARGIDTGDPTQYPNRVNGLVLGEFHIALIVESFQCSGSVVNTAAGDVVLTAGHCVVDPQTGASATNLVFIPGYRDGAEPFGEWPATSFAVPSQWQSSVGGGGFNSDEAGDMAMLTLQNRPADGAPVQSVVGAAGIAFNQARSQTYMQYGYPAETPYDGTRLYETTSPLVASDSTFSPATLGISSDFTGGSSGGPWLVGCAPAATSVTDYTYGNQPDVMYGPYFGSIAQQLFGRVGGSASGSAATGSTSCPSGAHSSSQFKLERVVRNRRRGTAVIVVSLPRAGTVTLDGHGIRTVVRHAQGAGTLRIPVRPRGSVALRLRNRGAARVRVTVTFAPTQGTPFSFTRRIRLQRH